MKETYYFQHDYNARNDPKLQDVLRENGLMGIGLYWCIVEQLYEQEGFLMLSSCKSIAFAMHVDCNVVEHLILDFGLFENDGEKFWSNSLNARLQKRKTISQTRKLAAEKRWKSSRKQTEEYKCNANAMQKQCYKRKEKKRKEKEKDIDIEEPKGSMSSETSSKDSGSTILKDVLAFFNAEVLKEKSLMPQIKTIQNHRKTSLEARIREYGKETVVDTLRKAICSDFLNGRNARNFVATFDWVLRPNNFPKVLEGNYANKQPTSTTNNTTRHDTNDYRNECLEAVQELLAEGSQPRHAPSILRGI